MEPEPERVPLAEHRRPEDGRSRDRVWVHIVWEVLLAAAVVGAVFAVRAEDAAALRGDGLRDLLVLLAAVLSLSAGRSLLLDDAPDLRRWAWPLAGGALLVSAAGGLLGLLPGVR